MKDAGRKQLADPGDNGRGIALSCSGLSDVPLGMNSLFVRLAGAVEEM
jgi:hypothetical protein